MKFIKQDIRQNAPSSTFLLSQANKPSNASRKVLAGFAKVLVNGRVVKVDQTKPFQARMIGDPERGKNATHSAAFGVSLLEAVSANLEAGMYLLDKQELSLAKIGGKLSEVALALNQARQSVDQQEPAQERFTAARDTIRQLAKTTFDHTVLFSNAPSKPIVVAVPTLGTWEGLVLDRSDLSSPGLTAIDQGKVSPSSSDGFLLDPSSVNISFSEWRRLCIQNRLQWHLLSERLHEINHSLIDRAHNGNWLVPGFPENLSDGSLRRPHRNN